MSRSFPDAAICFHCVSLELWQEQKADLATTLWLTANSSHSKVRTSSAPKSTAFIRHLQLHTTFSQWWKVLKLNLPPFSNQTCKKQTNICFRKNNISSLVEDRWSLQTPHWEHLKMVSFISKSHSKGAHPLCSCCREAGLSITIRLNMYTVLRWAQTWSDIPRSILRSISK